LERLDRNSAWGIEYGNGGHIEIFDIIKVNRNFWILRNHSEVILGVPLT